MSQEQIENFVAKKIRLTQEKKKISYYDIVSPQDRDYLSKSISERIDEQIDIVMNNYKECIRQALLSKEVTANINQMVIYEANDFYLRITGDPMDKKRMSRNYTFNPLDSFAISSFLDSTVLKALNEALRKYPVVMNETFSDLCEIFASFDNWHEENMEALEKQTNLARLNSGI